MKVGVTGYGVVGKATADTLRRLGNTVLVHDISPERMDSAIAEGYAPLHEAEGVEIDFCCVPETHLEEALLAMPESPLIVVRSTVPPGTTDRLSTQTGRTLAYMPEFLKEATSTWDAMNPNFVIIGCYDKEKGDLLADLFAPLMAPVMQVTPPVAEMTKIALNAYLHTIISFWNEIHNICERVGVPSHLVGKLASQDPRVAAYGAVMHGTPVGGRCLPKDIKQLIEFAESLDYEPDLLREVQGVNEKLGLPLPSAREGTAPDPLGHLLPKRGAMEQRW